MSTFPQRYLLLLSPQPVPTEPPSSSCDSNFIIAPSAPLIGLTSIWAQSSLPLTQAMSHPPSKELMHGRDSGDELNPEAGKEEAQWQSGKSQPDLSPATYQLCDVGQVT